MTEPGVLQDSALTGRRAWTEPAVVGRRMRDAVESLRADGHLLEVFDEIDPVHQMAAYVVRSAGWPILFHRVRGTRFPVLYNLFGQTDWLAAWTGAAPGGLVNAFFDACEHPGQVRPTPPRHEVVLEQDIDLARLLPIGRDYPRQPVPYINPGVIFVRDPESGRINTSMHSLNVVAPDRLVIHVRAAHFGQIYGKWQRRGEPMPMAVALGLDPAVWLACGLGIDHPPSELEVASALAGPMAVAPCGIVDLEVPAAAEIVIEGSVPPNVRGPGGPEPLPTHLYSPPYHGPVMEVRRISAYSDAIVHGLLNGGPDHLHTMEWLKAFEIARHLRAVGLFDGVRAIKVNPSGGDYNSCAIAVDRAHAPAAREILTSLLTSKLRLAGLRRAIVVDEDIDVGDTEALDWALGTRVRPDRDLVIATGRNLGSLDPVARVDLPSKLGIDATMPPGEESEYAMIRVEWDGEVRVAPPATAPPRTAPQRC